MIIGKHAIALVKGLNVAIVAEGIEVKREHFVYAMKYLNQRAL